MFARWPAGYAEAMTDSQDATTKQGPSDPGAEGVEAPTPPGGPQRQDDQRLDSGRSGVAGGHDDEASGSRVNDKHAEEAGGHTIPIEQEQSRPEPASEASDQHENVREENAESSLDQPSGV